ncbi:DUF6364 family protein [Endozoicomonas euniceicola]|uniref:DUF6364 family protein n=1 Tax=Endozoicomonas euniceicola TaxID=1234143 RepID=A0ABY6GSF8_9GAMM|nr:DUF6364 family protein [Endozoicomonas euniceicola]UYM15698.1 DUF6364 family protein [Endozoicomonas euniceicola]
MSKLILTINPEVIRQARAYAASQQLSLSKLVENYLKSLPLEPGQNELKLTSTTAELAGIIDEKELDNIDSYTDHLREKY